MEEFYLPSHGGQGQLHCVLWQPEQPPVAVVQVIHGIAEHVERYGDFAAFLNRQGIAVVAEDHMGHGKTRQPDQPLGRFYGGWDAAVADSYGLTCHAKERFPDIPIFLFGHSMGSFLARTILIRYPNAGYAGAMICGTGWQPEAVLRLGIALCNSSCKRHGEDYVDKRLRGMIFGGYNKRVKNPRTDFDWLCADPKVVDRYIEDPLCGFAETVSLDRDMLTGIQFIQQKKNLAAMNKDLPVLFLAGQQDPVGSYGKGVVKTVGAFCEAGMRNVSLKLYPSGRHEILNEAWKNRVYSDIFPWIREKI